ncbi:MAG: hypothetical protein M9910_08525 [Kiritimatiellae bacterium]|nr:hypothetical protein [Kiritimatiellia bacterium]
MKGNAKLELVLGEAMEEMGLVFGGVGVAAAEERAFGGLFEADVVAGGEWV